MGGLSGELSGEIAFLGCSALALPLRRPDFPADLVPSVVDILFPYYSCQPEGRDSALFAIESRFLLVPEAAPAW